MTATTLTASSAVTSTSVVVALLLTCASQHERVDALLYGDRLLVEPLQVEGRVDEVGVVREERASLGRSSLFISGLPCMLIDVSSGSSSRYVATFCTERSPLSVMSSHSNSRQRSSPLAISDSSVKLFPAHVAAVAGAGSGGTRPRAVGSWRCRACSEVGPGLCA